jgi:flagellar protein FlgJ
MTTVALPSTGSVPPAPAGREDPAKIRDAAQQFEALLLAQILRSAHDDNSGWLGSGDGASDCTTGLAEEQLARLLAEKGGLGLAQMIAAGLQQTPRAEPGPT